MAKSRSGKATSGGGITSNKRREVGYRGGKRTLDAMSPQAVSELGAQTAYKKAPLVKATPNDFVPMGNTVAAATKCGPGGSRTIYKSGFQSLSGPVSKGEPGMEGSKVDRGPRTILGEAPNHNSPFHPVPFRRGQQSNE
jgi:hypothetical protein